MDKVTEHIAEVDPNVDPVTGKYSIYEPPIESRLGQSFGSLRRFYEMNNYPLDRYHIPFQQIFTFDDLAARDGITPQSSRRAPYIVLLYFFGEGDDLVEYAIPSSVLANFDSDSFQTIVNDFERLSKNPQYYFMYRYCKFLVWRNKQK